MPLKPKLTPYGTYRIRGTHHGVAVDKSAGTRSYAEALAIAEAWERQIFEEKVLGRKPVETFAQIAIDYMKAGHDLGPLADEILVTIGDKPVDQISRADIDLIRATHYAHAQNSSANRNIVAPVSALMNWAADANRAPYKRWKRYKERMTKTNWRRPAEIEKIFAAMTRKETRALAAFHVGTGARASEGAFLHAIDVAPDLSQAVIQGDAREDEGTIAKGYEGTKGQYSRVVYIPPRARELMTGIVRTGVKGRAFLSSRGEPYADRNAIAKTLRKACERAELPPMSPHDLRHTWATWFQAVNGDLRRLQQQGGYSSLRLVERYAHIADSGLRREVLDSGWMEDPNSSGVGFSSGGPQLVVKNA